MFALVERAPAATSHAVRPLQPPRDRDGLGRQRVAFLLLPGRACFLIVAQQRSPRALPVERREPPRLFLRSAMRPVWQAAAAGTGSAGDGWCRVRRSKPPARVGWKRTGPRSPPGAWAFSCLDLAVSPHRKPRISESAEASSGLGRQRTWRPVSANVDNGAPSCRQFSCALLSAAPTAGTGMAKWGGGAPAPAHEPLGLVRPPPAG